jgi:hypothetical protein
MSPSAFSVIVGRWVQPHRSQSGETMERDDTATTFAAS